VGSPRMRRRGTEGAGTAIPWGRVGVLGAGGLRSEHTQTVPAAFARRGGCRPVGSGSCRNACVTVIPTRRLQRLLRPGRPAAIETRAHARQHIDHVLHQIQPIPMLDHDGAMVRRAKHGKKTFPVPAQTTPHLGPSRPACPSLSPTRPGGPPGGPGRPSGPWRTSARTAPRPPPARMFPPRSSRWASDVLPQAACRPSTTSTRSGRRCTSCWPSLSPS